VTDPDRLSRRVYNACREVRGAVEVEKAATSAVRSAVPFDRWCVLMIDPATALPTGGFHEQGLPAERVPALASIEARGEDASALHALARGRSRTAVLSHQTNGQLRSSERYRDVLEPSGVAHELRTVFTSGRGGWGALIMFRDTGRPDFTAEEAALVEHATATVATSIRRELVLTEIDYNLDVERGPGLLLLSTDLERIEATAAADAWLAEIDDGVDARTALPYSIRTTAARAQDVGAGGRSRARMRTKTGHWITLHAEPLGADGTISVIIEPTRPLELAELIADAYGLTAREREVARLLAVGNSRSEIARELTISDHTVDDHVKRAFAKVGVQSRAELTAKMFFDHNVPRMHAGTPLIGTGWFAQ